jgi:NAD(P)-dependent dehydrogenase (short-subunit alcohol dehydrogenase family)
VSGEEPGGGNASQFDAEAAARKQREIQSEQDGKDQQNKGSSAGGKEQAVQAGARRQPDQMPADHQQKPGSEADLALAPQFQAPDYRGSGKLDGFAAIVTGGDSGIGRAVAVLFAREGADVTVAYLDEHEDAAETKRCVEAEGRRCVLVAGDLKHPQFADKVVAATLEAFGHLDVLVNNAAFQEHAESLEDITDDRLEETFRTNIFGYVRMARAALPHLKKGASIINTGSVTGLEGSARLLDYSATKGAIHAFTKSLAQSLIDKGIRVNAVAPGPVWTPLNPADSPAEKVARFGKDTDMKRPAQPEEISPAYVFLAAPVCSGYITGIVLPVTGSVGAF